MNFYVLIYLYFDSFNFFTVLKPLLRNKNKTLIWWVCGCVGVSARSHYQSGVSVCWVFGTSCSQNRA